MNNLLKLKKGPIAANNPAKAENTVNGNNGILKKAVDNIVNSGNANANSGNDANLSPVRSNLPTPVISKSQGGNGVIGRFMKENNLPGADNYFMNSYNKIIQDAVERGRASRNSDTSSTASGPPSPQGEGSGVGGSTSLKKAPEVVQVRSYVSPYSQFPLTYDSDLNKVYLGGREVPIAHISEDGRSYARKSDLDALINELRFSDPNSKDAMIQRIVDYGKNVDNAVSRLKQREKFNYNYRTDPTYQAYVSQYDAMRDKAIREAISANVSRTGGVMNSNAASVAHQTAAEYDRMKANIIPTLEAQAYQRYANENQLNNDAAAAIGNIVNAYIGNIASIYGQQDSRDYSKYAFDKELAESARVNNNENDRLWAGMTAEDNRWYQDYLLDLRRLGLTERELDFDEWYNATILGHKYSGKSPGVTPGINPSAGTGVPIG